MPSIVVKLYSVFFKFLLKHRLQARFQTFSDENGTSTSASSSVSSFDITSCLHKKSLAPAKPSFNDSIANKDLHIDPFTSLSIRIFLPDSALLCPYDPSSKPSQISSGSPNSRPQDITRRNNYDPNSTISRPSPNNCCSNYGGVQDVNATTKQDPSPYRRNSRDTREPPPKLPEASHHAVVSRRWVLFWSNDSVTNDFFCWWIAKLCDMLSLRLGTILH